MRSLVDARQWDWLTQPPREVLRDQLLDLPSETLTLAALSAITSYALADSVAAQLNTTYFATSVGSLLIGWLAITAYFQQTARLFSDTQRPYVVWLRAGAVALLPLHLCLPAALLTRSWGDAGFIVYELAKLVFVLSVFKRWRWSVEALTGWPPWACALLLLSPIVLACIGLVFSVFFFGLAVVAALAGGVG
jgi:hypothetical protein